MDIESGYIGRVSACGPAACDRGSTIDIDFIIQFLVFCETHLGHRFRETGSFGLHAAYIYTCKGKVILGMLPPVDVFVHSQRMTAMVDTNTI